MNTRTTIAIIGMGPTGAALVCDLLGRWTVRPPHKPILLTLIDPSDEMGMGYAFRSAHALNMRADTMSIKPHCPGHFRQWLKNQPTLADHHEAEYPPRAVFGRYLADSLTESIDSLDSSSVEIEHWRTRAADLERIGDAFQVTDGNGIARNFSGLVLAAGESRYNALDQHVGQPHFIASPWETAEIAALPSSANIALAGSSLSAVDACLQLLAQRHSGRISCFSRSRGFPKVQGAFEYYQPAIIDRQWLKQATGAGRHDVPLRTVAAGLKEELDHCMDAPYEPGDPDPREWFSAEGRSVRLREGEATVFAASVETAARTPTRWYYALDSLSPLLPELWRAIVEPDQLRFLRSYRSTWNEYRHSMPLVSATALLPAVADGQIAIRRGLKSAHPTMTGGRRGWRITSVRDNSRPHDEEYDFLVDATGGQIQTAVHRDPLLRSATRRGILRPDARGGVRVDFETCQVEDALGDLSENLYLIGPLTFGTHFYTNSFEMNRANASRVAGEIERALDRPAPAPLRTRVDKRCASRHTIREGCDD